MFIVDIDVVKGDTVGSRGYVGGGHLRRLLAVTPLGVEVLSASWEALYRLWDGLDPILGRRPT